MWLRYILEIVGPNVVSLVDDRDKFKIAEDKASCSAL
jgi:hypothetical protein